MSAPAGSGHAAARTLTEAGPGPAVIVHRSHAPPLLTALLGAVSSGGVRLSEGLELHGQGRLATRRDHRSRRGVRCSIGLRMNGVAVTLTAKHCV
ncbi:MAG: hypothetical protein EOM24_17905 [Chloroflexia bacterium]|nr:hypothetical protein [Chloroflexia bacterium]